MQWFCGGSFQVAVDRVARELADAERTDTDQQVVDPPDVATDIVPQPPASSLRPRLNSPTVECGVPAGADGPPGADG